MELNNTEYAKTIEKIDKLNERAAKRGWTGRITVTSETVTETKQNAIGLMVTRTYNDVTISGEPPCYDGWTFLASLDFDPEIGLVVNTAPGVDKIDRTGLADGECQHCGTNRYRRRCYLVRNESGKQMQVGSTCIKDFLGWSANPVFISTEKILDELDGFCGSSPEDERYGVDTVLAASWATIQTFGYVRANDYSGTPTKHVVLDVLDPRSPRAHEIAKEVRPHIAESAAMAAKIREWVISDAFTGDNEYVTNLKAIAASETCAPKHFGLLVSAPQTWARSIERDLQRKADNEGRCNEWAGAVGDKLEITVNVKAISYIDGDYGTSTKYTMQDESGKVYQWFASRSALGDEVTDDPIRIKGTVKKLNEWKGNKTTKLTRCKILA